MGLERRGVAFRVLLVVTIGLWLGGARDSGAESRVPARLVWDGGVCGSADDFAARVGKRTNAVRFVQRGQRLVVRARIERRGDGLDARASIEVRGRAPIVRHIESPDCDDALDALALVVAIGVEGGSQPPRAAPRARRRPPRPAPPEPPVDAPVPPPPPPPQPGPSPAPVGEAPIEPALPAAPPEVVPTSPPPSDEPPGGEPPPLVPSEPPAAESAPPPAAPPAAAEREPGIDSRSASVPSELDIGVGLSGALSIGVAPRPLLGGALWVSVGWARESLWSPELVASLQHLRLDGLTRVNGRADFALSIGSVSLCPLRLGNDVFAVRPCASGALGRLAGDGYDTFDPRSSVRTWAALGATLEGLARVGVVEFRAVLGATAPLSRDSFSFARPCFDDSSCSADVFHHVEPVVWSGALGAGVRVW